LLCNGAANVTLDSSAKTDTITSQNSILIWCIQYIQAKIAINKVCCYSPLFRVSTRRGIPDWASAMSFSAM